MLQRKFTVEYPHPYNKIGDGPEGPEVRNITDNLNQALNGKYLMKIVTNEKSKFHDGIPGYDEIKHLLPLKILSVWPRGKLIVFECEKDVYIVNHLIMTGKWL